MTQFSSSLYSSLDFGLSVNHIHNGSRKGMASLSSCSIDSIDLIECPPIEFYINSIAHSTHRHLPLHTAHHVDCWLTMRLHRFASPTLAVSTPAASVWILFFGLGWLPLLTPNKVKYLIEEGYEVVCFSKSQFPDIAKKSNTDIQIVADVGQEGNLQLL